MKVSIIFTKISMLILSGLASFILVFSIFDQIEYGIGRSLMYIIPVTIGVVLLSIGYWYLKKWSLYGTIILIFFFTIEQILEIGYLLIDTEFIVGQLIIGLVALNYRNLKPGLK